MCEQSLVIDAWIREAQEVSTLVEDIESRTKNKDMAKEHRFRETHLSKLLEVGTKLDRLEALLYNPPSKPILTGEDLEFRWKMLSDFRQRTKVLALSLYTSASAKRAGGLASEVTNLGNGDQMNSFASYNYDDPQLLRPLVSDEATPSQVQNNQHSFFSMSLLRKVIWAISWILGAAALFFVLVIVSAIIYMSSQRYKFCK